MSSSSTTHEFPSPIGGAPFPIDFAPSILFSVLHALLIPVFVWRMSFSRTRQYVLFGALVFAVERTVFYALRAHAAHDAGARTNESLETYLQTTLAGGFISIGMDLMQLTRALLVNATKGSAVLASEAKVNKDKKPDWGSDVSFLKEGFDVEGFAGFEDHPRARKLIRQIGGAALALFWVTIVLGIVSGVDYQHALHSGAQTDLVRTLWYISTALGLFLLVALAAGAVWACRALPRVPRSSTTWIVLVAALASTVAIYRLVVMRFTTTSLLSDAPGSLNSLQSKITFYIFHSSPEYLAVAILITLDVRRVFMTGLWGDRRYADPKPSSEH
ncbi:hypothetical protein L226DRAFT_615215 [Lentinus tigrinus ALCF2SS1-7]|uniref:Uncharacterized protein n=1 Tax=Lentinus tigrinus ALCF2SS1-6 TaxID=1328759 RepID=A0A5C2S473_9APHY|nr:hypothetical protein L227DRAFT_577683 [Lentinus tigrinus ALCF2SS1-6]RPD71932.1 hypothetical protein L226DRAFT_615215 [Lentinus tigrinus ALCF2SS1-7]